MPTLRIADETMPRVLGHVLPEPLDRPRRNDLIAFAVEQQGTRMDLWRCLQGDVNEIDEARNGIRPGAAEPQRILAQGAEHLDVVGGLDIEAARGRTVR